MRSPADAGRNQRRIPATGIALAYAGILIALAGVLLVDVHLSLSAGVNDDAGYYFRIARNAARGRPDTFDGIHRTNGFNPLLEFLDTWAFALAGTEDALRCFRVGVGLTWGFAVAAFAGFAALLHRTRDWQPRTPRLLLHGCTAAFLASVLLKEYYGLDAYPALCFQVLFVVLHASRWPAGRWVRYAVLGGIALAACLARLDALSFATAFAVYYAVLAVRGELPGRAVLAFAMPLVAGLGLYVASNLQRFGIVLPVSGMLKNSFPHPDPATAFRTIVSTSSSLANSAVFYAALGCGAAGCVWTLRRLAARHAIGAGGWQQVLVPLSLYALMHTSFYSLFSRFDFQGTYMLFLYVYLLLLACCLAARAGSRWRGASAVAGAALLGAALLLVGVRAARVVQGHAAAPVDELDIGREIDALTDPGDVLFGENFGLVGFFSERAFINGDGVVNDVEYLQHRTDEGPELAAYFDRERVTHVFGNADDRVFRADRAPVQIVKDWPHSVRGHLQLARRPRPPGAP